MDISYIVLILSILFIIISIFLMIKDKEAKKELKLLKLYKKLKDLNNDFDLVLFHSKHPFITAEEMTEYIEKEIKKQEILKDKNDNK